MAKPKRSTISNDPVLDRVINGPITILEYLTLSSDQETNYNTKIKLGGCYEVSCDCPYYQHKTRLTLLNRDMMLTVTDTDLHCKHIKSMIDRAIKDLDNLYDLLYSERIAKLITECGLDDWCKTRALLVV